MCPSPQSPGGSAVMRSPWLIQTVCFSPGFQTPSKSADGPAHARPARGRTRDGARSPPCRRAARPSPSGRSRCRAPACRPRRSPAARAGCRLRGTEPGPPERITPFGRSARKRLGGLVERHDLAIDARLAHAPRDELRHLAAEIDDEDGGMGGGTIAHAAAVREMPHRLQRCSVQAHRATGQVSSVVAHMLLETMLAFGPDARSDARGGRGVMMTFPRPLPLPKRFNRRLGLGGRRVHGRARGPLRVRWHRAFGNPFRKLPSGYHPGRILFRPLAGDSQPWRSRHSRGGISSSPSTTPIRDAGDFGLQFRPVPDDLGDRHRDHPVHPLDARRSSTRSGARARHSRSSAKFSSASCSTASPTTSPSFRRSSTCSGHRSRTTRRGRR